MIIFDDGTHALAKKKRERMKLCGFADELWVEPHPYTACVTRRIESHVRACVPGWLWPIDYALTTYYTPTSIILNRIETSG